MKGAYSSPDNVLSEYSQQSLFPDSTYGLDSGGDPKHIIELTFEQFKAFHEKYYHPSNARLYFYGNDDLYGVCSWRMRTSESLITCRSIQHRSAVALRPPQTHHQAVCLGGYRRWGTPVGETRHAHRELAACGNH